MQGAREVMTCTPLLHLAISLWRRDGEGGPVEFQRLARFDDPNGFGKPVRTTVRVGFEHTSANRFVFLGS